jgi:adenosylcobinamide-phosphate synthase
MSMSASILLAAVCGFAADLLLGDPEAITATHPVVFIAKAIDAMEKLLRRRFPATPEGERAAGRVMAAMLPVAVWAFAALVLQLLWKLWPPLSFAVQVIWCWRALAVRDLRVESMRVYDALTSATLEDARKAVARIVGRDTNALTEEGVTKAAVETVAENFSDGIVAPMLYMLIGGAPLALAYKAVNTMDSTVGYKNERYLHFGRAAALLDDAVNFIPARLSALLLIAAAKLTGADAAGALRIWKRDRRNHASPNSAQSEAAMAGALGVKLAGPAYYFGRRHEKPTIGDELRPIEPEDIPRANRIVLAASVLGMVLLGLLRGLTLL